MPLQQEKRLLNLNTPLGEDVLFLTSFSGDEEISRLFSFQLELISEETSIQAKQIVGKNVTFSVERGEGERSYFNGFVSRFVAGDESIQGRRNYSAEVVPWLWFLTQTSDCRIFQNMTIPDIIKQVFDDLGFSDYDDSGIQGSHKEWEYCVQYRETAFNFVSRLLEQAGIFYYFVHEDGKHTLYLADSSNGYKDCEESTVDYPFDFSGIAIKDHLTAWEHQFSFRTGKWTHTDYNFKTPKDDLEATIDTTVSLDGNKQYEIYDYPGEYLQKSEGDAEVRWRMEEREVEYDVVHASSSCRTFFAGGRFAIGKHRSAGEEGKKFVITRIHHAAEETMAYETGGSGGMDYRNSFSCVPDSVTFRPERTTPKSVICGVQTAVVVGPDGEEIYCDEHGRVKVQFHWDRVGENDEKSSCWIRTANAMAGRQWGFVAIPRIGQEVVVNFLEGDPDRPLIVGSVYNADQMPHYKLPDEKNKIYFKTNSTKGGDGFNELMFDDTKDEERVFLHAEKNLDVRVKNDSKNRTYGNRHQIIGWEKDGNKGGDQKERVYQDKHLNVKRDQIEQIEGNYQLMVGNGEAENGGRVDLVVEKQMAVSIGADGQQINIEGDQQQKIEGSQSITVAGDQKEKVGSQSLTVQGAQQITSASTALEASGEVHLKGGNVVVEAGTQLTLKVGGNFVSITQAGVDIQGIMVKINSGGAAGSGAGSSPTAPDEPAAADVQQAQPAEPAKAHNSQTGQKSCD